MTSYLNTINSEGVVLNINSTSGYGVVIGNDFTSILGTRTLGATTYTGAISGTSATFSSSLGVTGLATFGLGGVTSTSGPTTLGPTTIGAITGTSSTFSSTVSIDGLASFGGGITSTVGTRTFGAISMNAASKISGLGTPVLNSDAVTKLYTDNLSLRLTRGPDVSAVSSNPGTIGTSFSDGSSVGGVTVATGNDILINAQSDPKENGIYTVTIGAPTRVASFANASVQSGVYVHVTSGSLIGSGYVLAGTVTVGTDNVNFSKFTTGAVSVLNTTTIGSQAGILASKGFITDGHLHVDVLQSNITGGSDINLSTFLRSNASTTTTQSILIGVNTLSKNAAILGFRYTGSGLDTNYLRLGLNGSSTGLRIFGDDTVTFPSTITSSGLITASNGLTSTIGTTTLGTTVTTGITASSVVSITSSTISSSSSSGALIVTGGVGVGGSVNIGGGFTSTAGTTTLGATTIGAITGTSASFTLPITSTLASGTAPFTVASTTVVANLNAGLLNGATFAAPGAIGGTTASTGTFTSISATGAVTITSTTDATSSTGGGSCTISGGVGIAKKVFIGDTLNVTGTTTMAGLNATSIGGTAPGTGAFTTITASSTLGVTGTTTMAGLNATSIGSTTPGTGAFTSISVTSNTVVANLNASSLNGATFAAPGAIGGGTAGAGAFTTISVSSTLNVTGTTTMAGLNATSIGGTAAGTGAFTSISATGVITSTLASGTAPFTVASTTVVANLNASLLGGATFAAPGAIGGTTASTGAFTSISATGAVTITSTTDATSSTGGGSCTISGGVGIAKKVFIGDTLNVTGTTTMAGLNATSIGSTTPGTGAFTSISATGAVTITSTTDATSSTGGGSCTISGGVGIAKKVFIGDTLGVSGITTLGGTTSTTVGATGAVVIPTTLNVSGITTLGGTNSATISSTGAVAIASTLNVTGTTALGTTNTAAITASGLITASNGLTSTVGTTSLGTTTSSGLITANNGITLATGSLKLSPLTASTSLALDSSQNIVSVTNTGTGSNVLANAPTFTGDIEMGGKKISGLGTPTVNTDAATKLYVDSAIQGLDTKDSVRVATTATGVIGTSFAHNSVVDGVTLVTGNRILIKDQGTAENGLYIVNSTGAPTRTADFAGGSTQSGSYVFVESGTVNINAGFVLQGTVIVGTTDPTTFSQFSGAGQILAGTGLSKVANTINLNASQIGLTLNSTIIGSTTPSTGAFTTISASGATTLGTSTAATISSTGSISIPNTTASSSTSTGALTVAGGVGIAGAVNIGGGLTNTVGTTTLGSTTVGAITGSSASFSSTLGVSGITTLGATNPATVSASGAVAIASTLGVSGITTLGATNPATVSASGGVAIASTLGVTGTTTLGTTSTGNLSASGTFIAQVSQNSAYLNSIYNSNTGSSAYSQLAVQGDASALILSVSSSTYTGANNVARVFSNTGPLSIGDASILTTLLGTRIHISGTTASSSTSTGALTVAGGAGIAGALYIGNIFRATVSIDGGYDNIITNNSTGSNAYSLLSISGNTAQLYLYANSSTRSGSGGANSLNIFPVNGPLNIGSPTQQTNLFGPTNIAGIISQEYTAVTAGDIVLARFMRSGAADGTNHNIHLGVNTTANNSALIGFGYFGSGLSTNFLRFSLSNATNGVRILGDESTTFPANILITARGANNTPNTNGIWCTNPTNTTGNNAVIGVQVAGASASNPYFSMDISGVQGWSMGIDNGDSDKFKIMNSWSFNSLPRLTITTAGLVGIGITNPSNSLHINGNLRTEDPYIRAGPGNDGGMEVMWNTVNSGVGKTDFFNFRGLGGGGFTFKMKNSSNSDVGYAPIDGGAYTNASDLRIKKNIVTLEPEGSLDKINNLRAVSYKFKDTRSGERINYGMIAQEVYEVFPGAVTNSNSFVPSINCYTCIISKTSSTTYRITDIDTSDLTVGDEVRICQQGDHNIVITELTQTYIQFDSSKTLQEGTIHVYGKRVVDFKSVTYNDINILSISAIQQLSNIIDAQQQLISNLTARIEALENS